MKSERLVPFAVNVQLSYTGFSALKEKYEFSRIIQVFILFCSLVQADESDNSLNGKFAS